MKNYHQHIHVITKGDTLYLLARKYDVKIMDIIRLNPYINVYNLNIGDEVHIRTTDVHESVSD